MAELLIELFSEEIPARMQARAGDDLKRLVTEGLVEAGLTYAGAAAFATPRRLCLTMTDVPDQSPATREERKGPREDAPEKAVEGFLRSTGLTKDQLELRETGKGNAYFAVIEKTGQPAEAIIATVLENTIRNFPWPKSMRWGSGPLKWVRPLHSILCILSDETGARVVPLDVDGITSGDRTFGHRFMAPKSITVSSFEDYASALKHAHVVLDPEERRDAIWNDATNMAFAQGLEVVQDAALLREVAGLVEWPVVLMGDIGADFLDLPPEVLQTSMREHQKFFSVRNPKTGRIEKFVTVANRETADNGATILAGNQKVLAARLSDAKFFWENDLRIAKAGMDEWLASLNNVTFHAKLGTQSDRINRIAALAREIAPAVSADPEAAVAAAKIAKADLASEMVYEFPELQGVMGKYYAHEAGLDAATAAVAEEHWGPLGPTDDVPTAPLSVAVALADKLDTLTGFWAIDEKPTGSKDPFALRRAALGVIRLAVDNDIRLPLTATWKSAFETHVSEQKLSIETDTSAELLSFFHDRLKVYLRDQSVRHDVIDACLAMEGSDDLTKCTKRAKVLGHFVQTDDGANLVQGFKRANNILTQAETNDGVEYSYGADRKFTQADEERDLFDALEAAEAVIDPAIKSEDFEAAMTAMAALRAPIDAFFEAVQVNSDNAVVRRNRLNLLAMIRKTCLTVADLNRIEG